MMVGALNVSTEKPEPGVVALTIEVAPEDYDRAREQAWRRVSQRVVIPGFRRGKAPRALVERQVGAGVVDEEALRNLLPQVFDRAVEDAGVAPIERPQFSVEQMEPGQPLVVKATVAVRPTVDLDDYRGVRVEAEPVEVSDEEVERLVQQLREQRAQWVPVEDRPLDMGDGVVVDLDISWSDGRTSEHQDLEVVLGQNQLPAGFDAHLVGAQPGETREFTLTWKSTDREGLETERSAAFRAAVKGVRRQELPELNDEFAQGLGYDSPARLREATRARLLEQKEAAARVSAETRALEATFERAIFEIPARLIEAETQTLAEEQRRALQEQRLTPERYLQLTGQTSEQWEARQREEAERQLRTRLLLDQIAEQESIEVAPEEVATEVQRALAAYREHAGKARRALSTPEARRQLERNVRRRKTLEWLGQMATGQLAAAQPVEDAMAATASAAEQPAAVGENPDRA